MQFRTELHPKPFGTSIALHHRIMLVGSCFTDHMAQRFEQHFFATLNNPHGILFNPISIAQAIHDVTTARQYAPEDLFYHHQLWQSWQHHGQFSHPDPSVCLKLINNSIAEAHAFLQTADWLFVTLGSSFLYTLKNTDLGGQAGQVVANCHKVAANHFNHQLAGYEQIETALHQIVTQTVQANPNLQIVFTISPVRHSREGLIENNRSKALLHTAVAAIVDRYPHTHYFPAYELVVDDLRDYRFYAEDLVHPNHQATQYVWEKLCAAAIAAPNQPIMKKLGALHLAMRHRPIHPQSVQHRQFLEAMLHQTEVLASTYPALNLDAAAKNFAAQLNELGKG